MQYNGEFIIQAVVNRLNEKNIRCYDSAIVAELASLNGGELNQLITFGDVVRWRNDRILKKKFPLQSLKSNPN